MRNNHNHSVSEVVILKPFVDLTQNDPKIFVETDGKSPQKDNNDVFLTAKNSIKSGLV